MTKQYHIGLEKENVGRYVILTGDPQRVQLIAKYLDNAVEVANKREFITYTGYLDGEKVSVTSTGIGCPSAAICIEELVNIGADTFIRVGTSGTLQDHVELGDISISTASIRDEGTTRQYVPIEFPAVADIDVVIALKQAAQQMKFKYHVGINHCKDSFYSEEPDKTPLLEENQIRWKIWQRANAITTSMESAALFVIGTLRKVRVGEVLSVASMSLDGHPVVMPDSVERAIKSAIEAIRILKDQDKA
ncbi:nucleoside phosphorylase [bacterium]|nr:MAG: nucleoside phosphorylase [bacterium]